METECYQTFLPTQPIWTSKCSVPINFNTEFCYFLLMVGNSSLVQHFHGECLLPMKNFQTLKVHDCYQESFFSAHIIWNMFGMSIKIHMTCKLSKSFFPLHYRHLSCYLCNVAYNNLSEYIRNAFTFSIMLFHHFPTRPDRLTKSLLFLYFLTSSAFEYCWLLFLILHISPLLTLVYISYRT